MRHGIISTGRWRVSDEQIKAEATLYRFLGFGVVEQLETG